MFRKIKDMHDGYRSVRQMAAGVMIGCAVVCAVVIWKSYSLAQANARSIYVLAGSKAIEAFSSPARDNLPVEMRDHIKTFHEKFFTLDPDEKVIRDNLEAALYMADGSAKRQYALLKENGYYTEIVAGNISQRIDVDSVDVRTTTQPYSFTCYATQTIVRPSQIVRRSLITEGLIRQVSRSDHNPHGLLIEKWTTKENKDLETKMR